MEKRLEAFTGDSLFGLKEQVNAFLQSCEGSLHDVLYQHQITEDSFDYSVILIYTPKKREDERKKG